MAHVIAERATPRDVVLISATYYDEPFNYYYHGPVDRQGVSAADVPAGLERLTQGRAWVWLILCGEAYGDPQGEISSWLSVQRGPAEQIDFPGIRLCAYGAPLVIDSR